MAVLDSEIQTKIDNLRLASKSWSEKIAVYEIVKIDWGGAKNGLRGKYYSGTNFNSFKFSRIDATIDFDWGTGSPIAGISDNFTIRWEGYVLPQFSETYTFYGDMDNGVRIWVNDVLVADDWVNSPPEEISGTIALTANTKYKIKVEYKETTGGAYARLKWSSASQTKQIIPNTRLFAGKAQYLAKVPVHLESSVALPFADEVEARLMHEGDFLTVEGDSTLSDSEISLKVWDGGNWNAETGEFENQGTFGDLAYEQGEGIRAEVYLWFPSEELLLSDWQGHLRADEESDFATWRGKIANGFRSSELDSPGRAHYTGCQAIYGGDLETLAEVTDNDCPHDAHLPGGTVGNGTLDFCDRKNLQSCIDRGINPLYHLSHYSAVVTVLNNQTKGPQLLSIARGNESNLKEPVRVVMGTRKIRDMQVLAFRRDYNNNTPDRGWFAAIYEACEGPVSAIYGAIINGQTANPLHYNYRLGSRGQTPVGADLSTHGYSGTVLIRYNYGWVNPATVGPDTMRAEAFIIGLNNIRVYSDFDSYTENYTTNRVWQTARIYCDKRWGLGNDYQILKIESWIIAATWSSVVCRFTDPFGNTYDYARSNSNVELTGRSGASQIEDMCLAGRLTRPFLFQNKVHIEPIRALTEEELEDCDVFTDTGAGRNIIVDDSGLSTLRHWRKSDNDLPNRIEATINDATKDFAEVPINPVEDIEQQLKAGKVQGYHSRHVVPKKYSFLGVTDVSEATALAYWILWFGEFGEGGTKNNLKISFNTFILETLKLHENKIIKVESAQLARYGFDYFKIDKFTREPNLIIKVECTAYNHDEMTDFETPYAEIEDPEPPVFDWGGGEYTPGEIRIPTKIEFGSMSYSDGLLRIQLQEA